MTLSLSLLVCPSVMKEFFKKLNGVSREFQECFNEVSMMFHASLNDRKFQGCFKKVSGVFQKRLKGVLREF